MKTPLFHPLKKGDFLLPEGFPDPFLDTPHPLAQAAAEALMQELEADPFFGSTSFEGKMFGVLVVQDSESQSLGYLAAFSGSLQTVEGPLSNHRPGFIPPIYDLLDPAGFFKPEEAKISALNHALTALDNDPDYQAAVTDLAQAEAAYQRARQRKTDERKVRKAAREQRRATGNLSEEQAQALIRESQFEKAEFRRWDKAQTEHLVQLRTRVETYQQQQSLLRQERATRSQALEQRIFEAFRLTNALGEWKSIWELSHLAPGGTGECAAPKLLQYAWTHHYRPIALAEFWWEPASGSELRHHKHYYGACRGKCGLILPFLLRGLTVVKPGETHSNPLPTTQPVLSILWEDEALLVANKPSGLLSLPGKDGTRSLLEYLNDARPTPLLPVHRLDRDTSGLLVFAKTTQAQRLLQIQFQEQQVAKEYIALLENVPTNPECMQTGSINLPLAPDWINRPRQKVDFQEGKPSLTHFTVLTDPQHSEAHPRICFVPITGRTHQLRVHAAHPHGLGAPILGDPLYGSEQKPLTRLCLHASRIALRHPLTGEPCCLYCPPEF